MEDVQFTTDHFSIYMSSYLLDNSHFNSILDKFVERLKPDLKSIQKKYNRSQSNEDRVALFQKYFEWSPPPPRMLERLQKNATSSTHFRDQGNRDYVGGQLENALRSYNLALCFAPPGSLEESLGYANRSAILMQMKEYSLALKDIGHALGYCELDEERRGKLANRKLRCEKALAEIQDGENNLDENLTYCTEKLGQLKKPNLTLIGAESCIKMNYDKHKGRSLVAVEDIPPGTVLLRDKPFALALERLLTFDTENCATCAKPMLGGIPNPNSTFPMHCSLECLSSSQAPPNQLLTYIHQTSALHECLLPLTVLLSVPNSDLSCTSDPNLSNPDRISIYDPSVFSATYNLVQHRQNYNFSNSNSSTPPNEFLAIFLSNLVSTLSPQSPVIPPHLFLRLMENLPYSAISLCTFNDKYDEKNNTTVRTQTAFATAVLNLVALANNSCDPNALFFKHRRSDHAVLLAARHISAGEEVTISYKGHWSKNSMQERQTYLKEKYKFDCTCEACELGFQGDESITEEIELPDGMTVEELEQKLQDTQKEIEEVIKCVNEGRIAQAYEIVLRCFEFLKHFDSTFKLSVFASDLLKTVLFHLNK